MKYSNPLIELANEYENKQTSNIPRAKKFKTIYQLLLTETSFLPQDASATQRLYHVRNQLFEIPKCLECSSPVNWHVSKGGYVEFCSQKCAVKSPKTLANRKKSLMSKYGVDSFSKTDVFKDKLNHSIKNRTSEQWQEIQNKKRKNNLEKYGVEHLSQCKEIRDKINKTNLEKYGHTNYLASEKGKEHIKQTCMTKYGTNVHSTSTIPSNIRELINNRDFLIHEHHDKKKTLQLIANELDIDLSTLVKYYKKYDVTMYRYDSQSQGERSIVNFIQSLGIENINQNNRSLISPYELDIYLPEYGIAIEFCGLFWHCDLMKPINYHRDKYLKCEKLGIRLITIYQDEWDNNQELVKNKISQILGKSNSDKIHARKCSIGIVSNKEKKNFYDKNHIQGNGKGSISYGLFNNGILVACMTFINHKNGEFELNRYATSCNVSGGFSKLLSHFEKSIDWKEIITYADLRWSKGDVYVKNKFEYVHKTRPSYEYIIANKRVHKSNFSRRNLPKILGDDFDEALSESQNMDKIGIRRIWNCGLIKFKKINI